MAKCAICGTTIVMGGLKEKGSDLQYCSEKCQSKVLKSRFDALFQQFSEAIARVAAEDLQAPPDSSSSPGQDRDQGQTAQVLDSYDGMDLLVTLLGLGVCAAVAVLIYRLEGLTGYPIHEKTFWFVIPGGAFLSGFVAGSGFFLALRALNRLPRTSTFFAAVLGGAACYVLIYYLWWLAEVPGGQARDLSGFLTFLQYVIEHQQVRLVRGQGGAIELGKWGYARFAINWFGFVFGVFGVMICGGGKRYCSRCKQYMNRVGEQSRTGSDPEATAAALGPVIRSLSAGRVQEALFLHATSGEPGKDGFWTTKIVVDACPGCGMHKATMTATVPGLETGPKEVDGFKYEATTTGPVELTFFHGDKRSQGVGGKDERLDEFSL